MGYFSNGTEGDLYQVKYCERCVHYRNDDNESYDCPVLDLHMLWNYEQLGNNPEEIAKHQALSNFILRSESEGGIGNKQCKMFIPKSPAEDINAEPDHDAMTEQIDRELQELHERFLELQVMDILSEIELEEWAQIGVTLAREYVPELLTEIKRLKEERDA